MKYGVRVRHTTTAISARIKKAARTKEGSFSWTKDCPLPYIRGRKEAEKGSELVVNRDGARVTLRWQEDARWRSKVHEETLPIGEMRYQKESNSWNIYSQRPQIINDML